MGTIAEKLTAVANSKAAIASAITGKGGTVPTKFSDYGTAVSSLPNTYAAGDEGKVVSNGALVSQTSLTITENNTYDTTTKNSVTVNVSGGGGDSKFASLVDGSLTELTAQDLSGVTSIRSYAFYDYSNLASVTIPSSVTSIGEDAFLYCSNLASITIPSSVTTIGSWAFGNVSSLKNVYISDLKSYCEITFGSNINSCPTYPGKAKMYLNNSELTTISDSTITIIRGYNFTGCSSLTSINLGNAISAIGNETFESCANLSTVSIVGNGSMTIGTAAFANCSALTSLSLGDGVASIGEWAVQNCTALQTATIGTGLSTISSGAFSDCRNLATIDFGTTRSTIPTLANVNAFSRLPANYQILVPSALLDTWKGTKNWSNSAVVDHIVAHT